MQDKDLPRYEWFGRRTFWAVHCLACKATFSAWDLDPQRLELELALRCGYCGGQRVAHYDTTPRPPERSPDGKET